MPDRDTPTPEELIDRLVNAAVAYFLLKDDGGQVDAWREIMRSRQALASALEESRRRERLALQVLLNTATFLDAMPPFSLPANSEPSLWGYRRECVSRGVTRAIAALRDGEALREGGEAA